jgi:hypothetical protein
MNLYFVFLSLPSVERQNFSGAQCGSFMGNPGTEQARREQLAAFLGG